MIGRLIIGCRLILEVKDDIETGFVNIFIWFREGFQINVYQVIYLFYVHQVTSL